MAPLSGGRSHHRTLRWTAQFMVGIVFWGVLYRELSPSKEPGNIAGFTPELHGRCRLGAGADSFRQAGQGYRAPGALDDEGRRGRRLDWKTT